MIVAIHAKGGHSFGGLVNYLIEKEDRVAWTQTRNLITSDPQVAAQVMAATAMNHHALKQQAGIALAGRKPGGAVMHLTLSWKDEEAQSRQLSPEQMSQAVDIVLQNLGATKKQRAQYADEHQVVVVAHNDKTHPHLHLVINRVHPQHGVYLPSNNDFLQLSAWALKYEREGGRIYCPQRRLNWQAREKGQYVRGQKTNRRIWQLREDAMLPTRPHLDKAIEAEKRKDRPLYQERRAMTRQHAQAWQALSAEYRQLLNALKASQHERQAESIDQVRKDFQSQWEARFNAQEQETAKFLAKENSWLGRLQNTIDVVDWSVWRSPAARREALNQTLKTVSSASARLQSFTQKQQAETAALATAQSRAEATAAKNVQADIQRKRAELREGFGGQRQALIDTQAKERQSLRQKWATRNGERSSILERFSAAFQIQAVQEKVKSLTQRRPVQKQIKRPSPSPEEAQKLDELRRRVGLLNEFNSAAQKRQRSR